MPASKDDIERAERLARQEDKQDPPATEGRTRAALEHLERERQERKERNGDERRDA
jgi:hypothetical protein